MRVPASFHTSRSDEHATVQPSCEAWLPSSQDSFFEASGKLASTKWLPQVSFDAHSPEQPSPDTRLPSSQASPNCESTTLSPHRWFVQFVRQCEPGESELLAPSSHCSNRSRIPSPHRRGRQSVLQMASA